MRIAYIDDEPIARDNFQYTCGKIDEISSVECFDNYIELLDFLKKSKVDLVFADINMPGLDGLQLMQYIKDANDTVEVVYVTGYDEYALKAFEVGAFGYVLKPYNVDKIKQIIERFKKVTHFSDNSQRILEIRTFGRFDAFIDGQVIHFSNKKSKELFAILVDRLGGTVTMEQAIDILWEDRPYDEKTKNLYRIALKNLRDTLEHAGCVDILVESRGQRSINFANIKCDYYEYMKNPEKNEESFNGEYMSDYSWGEYTLAKLMDTY